MNMSETKKSELYKTISDTITDLRVEISTANNDGLPLSAENIDHDLFMIIDRIWEKQKAVLNIDDL